MTQEKEWPCEHITYNENKSNCAYGGPQGWSFHIPGIVPMLVPTSWCVCPICQAKHPNLEPTVSEKDWCKDITKDAKSGSFWLHLSTKRSMELCSKAMFCPICGTPRPTPKPSVLEEKFISILRVSSSYSSDLAKEIAKDLAKAAVEVCSHIARKDISLGGAHFYKGHES